MKTNLLKILAGIGILGCIGITYNCTIEQNIFGMPTGKILGDLKFSWFHIIPLKTFKKEDKFTKWFLEKANPGTEFYSE